LRSEVHYLHCIVNSVESIIEFSLCDDKRRSDV